MAPFPKISFTGHVVHESASPSSRESEVRDVPCPYPRSNNRLRFAAHLALHQRLDLAKTFLLPVPCDTARRRSDLHYPRHQSKICCPRRFHRGCVMKHSTGPHAFGLISVPLRDSPASIGSEQRLQIDRPVRNSKRTGKAACMVIILMAVATSFAAVPVSYAIHRHLHR
jgi:hypothetical protein